MHLDIPTGTYYSSPDEQESDMSGVFTTNNFCFRNHFQNKQIKSQDKVKEGRRKKHVQNKFVTFPLSLQTFSVTFNQGINICRW